MKTIQLFLSITSLHVVYTHKSQKYIFFLIKFDSSYVYKDKKYTLCKYTESEITLGKMSTIF